MSRKRRDIIPTATSQLVPKLAYSGVVQENIAESAQKGKKVPSIPPHKLVSTMDLWGGSRTAKAMSSVVKTAMGQVHRNHCQIRRAKADSADGYSTVMDHLEIASTYSEQEQGR